MYCASVMMKLSSSGVTPFGIVRSPPLSRESLAYCRLMAKRERAMTGPGRQWARLVPQAVRNHAAILSEPLHHSLVKRDILLRAAVRADMDVELVRQLLADRKAGVEVEQLQQVDDRRLI